MLRNRDLFPSLGTFFDKYFEPYSYDAMVIQSLAQYDTLSRAFFTHLSYKSGLGHVEEEYLKFQQKMERLYPLLGDDWKETKPEDILTDRQNICVVLTAFEIIHFREGAQIKITIISINTEIEMFSIFTNKERLKKDFPIEDAIIILIVDGIAYTVILDHPSRMKLEFPFVDICSFVSL
jgi:hypothetical protein